MRIQQEYKKVHENIDKFYIIKQKTLQHDE